MLIQIRFCKWFVFVPSLDPLFFVGKILLPVVLLNGVCRKSRVGQSCEDGFCVLNLAETFWKHRSVLTPAQFELSFWASNASNKATAIFEFSTAE